MRLVAFRNQQLLLAKINHVIHFSQSQLLLAESLLAATAIG